MLELDPTYEDYTAWGGSLDEESFGAALPGAASRVRARCAAFGGSMGAEEADAYIRAVCAAVDALGDGTAGMTGYTAGKVSATFSSSAAADNTVGAAIERELSGTRLACTGV